MRKHPLGEILRDLLEPPYVKPCERHCRELEIDPGHCSCLYPGEQEASMQHFVEQFGLTISKVCKIEPNAMIAYVIGPIRNSSSFSAPRFGFLAYWGAPNFPRPKPQDLMNTDSAVRNLLGTNCNRLIESKRQEMSKPDFPFQPSALDQAFDGDGSAYLFARDQGDTPRMLVSPPYYVAGFETFGRTFDDYIPKSYLPYIEWAFENRLNRLMLRHSTCCNQFEYREEEEVAL